MREGEHIWNAWRSQHLAGDNKPCTRVTVEKSFELRLSGTAAASGPQAGRVEQSSRVVLGQWKKGPARWYQRFGRTPVDPGENEELDSQIETELPNVVSVNHGSSIDSDAGQCDIVMLNVVPQGYGEAELVEGQFGDLGGFSFDHGGSQEAKARWGHAANPWFGVLVPNALVRVYQGFGGHEKELGQAIEDGNVVINGVYLIDEVTISTAGTIHLKCRDMAKLLIDQQVFPPLIPTNLYPLKYKRYTYQTFTIPPDPPPPATHRITNQPAHYAGSSTDATYGGFNTGATGHPPSDAQGSRADYWLSEPKAGPGDSAWIGFTLGGVDVNMIRYFPWAGNFLVQVSVKENGEWVPSEMPGQGGVTAFGLPYVSTFTTNWEGGPPSGVESNNYFLPRDYRANEIRLTVTNLAAAQEGGYRAGAREIAMLYDVTASQYPMLSYACAALPYNDENRVGYWQVRSNGRLYAFGDARVQSASIAVQDGFDHATLGSPKKRHDYPVIGMTVGPNETGYWTIDYSGRVVAYGSALWWGDAEKSGEVDVVDLAPTPSGNGYWILHKDGEVEAFGDATHHGNGSVSGTMPAGGPKIARSIESHPVTSGYWILLSDGTVQAKNLTNYGSANRTGFQPTEYVASIRRTHDGGGYWIPTGSGMVQAFGNAPYLGNAIKYPPENWVNGLCWDMMPWSGGDTGYAIQYADGNLYSLGDFERFGAIGEGSGQLRLDGNYKDYADIIKDLALWAGFYLRKNPQPGNEMPDVFGNIETTGIFSKDDLPQDMFDKKPVIEPMKTIRDIVGYIVYTDQEGGFRFESPNWWQMGNFKLDGTPYDFMPEIDERVNLFDYSMAFGDTNARSEITISSLDFTGGTDFTKPPDGTVVTRIVPPSASDLKGIVKPAMWSNGVFTDPVVQRNMADLIAMHAWFSRRKSSMTCTANPLIGINDQVRVWERQSGEVYVHYVRGVQFTHDLISGTFEMQLETHWMGAGAYGQTPLFFACTGRPQEDGYWQVDSNAQIYAFGAAQLHAKTTLDSHTEWVIAMRSTLSGEGYYTLDTSGKIIAYGDAVLQGDLSRPQLDVKDFALTPSGEGYWVVLDDGTVYAFGDAVHHGDASPAGNMPSGSPVICHAIESHPSDQGYWVLWSDGTVEAFELTNHGSANRVGFKATEYVGSLRRTSTGGGYWVPSGSGKIQAFGDAVDAGDGIQYPDERWVHGLVWDMVPHGTDGYAIQHADGTMDAIGTQPNIGSAGFGYKGRPRLWPIMTTNENARRQAGDSGPIDQAAEAVGVSSELAQFLQKSGSSSATNAVANAFGAPSDPTTKVAT